jgi:pimeloyl-ACP methyl ester carboxylesterase
MTTCRKRFARNERLRRSGVGLAAAFCLSALIVTPAPAGATTSLSAIRVALSRAPTAVATPKLSWHACQKAYQCAIARVPLDYRHPRGRTIHLAVIRHRATDPARRIGTLFVNPGGPGGSGVAALPGFVRLFPAAVRARFDIASWDPRGVGASTPVECFASAGSANRFLDGMVIGSSFPVGNAETARWIQRYRAFGRHCERHSGGLLRHVSTADTARDLDVLRAAVGDRKLNYYGFSYGTFLGATYANLFPGHVRAIVLDSNVEPRAYVSPQIKANGGRFLTTEHRERSDQSVAKTLKAFLNLCGADTSHCAFSAGSPAATQAKYTTLLRQLPRLPQTAKLTYAETVSAVGRYLGTEAAWPSLAQLLQQLWMTGNAKVPTVPTSQLVPLAAILCSESPSPPAAALPSLARFAFRRSGPLGVSKLWQTLPCASWPATAADRYAGPWDRRTANPLLVTNNTIDPNTPYQGAVAMTRELARARLLTVDGYGHGVLVNHSACATHYIGRYLIDKTLPPEGTVCQQNQPPFSGTQ